MGDAILGDGVIPDTYQRLSGQGPQMGQHTVVRLRPMGKIWTPRILYSFDHQWCR